jgi:pilus assembly protein CpaB
MRLIVMFVAIALAAGAFFVTMHFTSESDKEVPVVKPSMTVREVPTIDIYTAKQDIPLGTSIKPEMLDIQPWPKHLLLDDMVRADPNHPSDAVGMVVRTPFLKGEPIIVNKLANEKDPSFIAAELPPGMRAVTMSVDAISGAGGFVFPGDRVDVLLTHDVQLGKSHAASSPVVSGSGVGGGVSATMMSPAAMMANAAQSKGDPITEVLLSNVRVLAVNQKSTAHGGEPPMVPNNVTIEVTAGDAQRVRLSENGNGRLSLTIRSLKDKEETELVRPTGLGDLSRLTPPSYFPVLYGMDGRPNMAPDAQDNSIPAGQFVTVVRGVNAQDVEVTRP